MITQNVPEHPAYNPLYDINWKDSHGVRLVTYENTRGCLVPEVETLSREEFYALIAQQIDDCYNGNPSTKPFFLKD